MQPWLFWLFRGGHIFTHSFYFLSCRAPFWQTSVDGNNDNNFGCLSTLKFSLSVWIFKFGSGYVISVMMMTVKTSRSLSLRRVHCHAMREGNSRCFPPCEFVPGLSRVLSGCIQDWEIHQRTYKGEWNDREENRVVVVFPLPLPFSLCQCHFLVWWALVSRERASEGGWKKLSLSWPERGLLLYSTFWPQSEVILLINLG